MGAQFVPLISDSSDKTWITLSNPPKYKKCSFNISTRKNFKYKICAILNNGFALRPSGTIVKTFNFDKMKPIFNIKSECVNYLSVGSINRIDKIDGVRYA